jgi:hypothetical protein
MYEKWSHVAPLDDKRVRHVCFLGGDLEGFNGYARGVGTGGD